MDENGKQIEEYTGNITYTYEKNMELLRGLWEEVFDDPEEFVDYYFENVCKENKVLSAYVGDKLIGMLYLNPYNMLVDGEELKSYYVVGVAVVYSMREKGIMKAMMKKALEDVSKEGIEFVFLMPALEDYYNNLGFKKIYNTKTMDFTITEPEDFERDVSDCYASLMLCTEHLRDFALDDLASVADIINQKLTENHGVFCERNKEYLESVILEHNCQSGDMCVVTEHMLSENEDEAEDKNIVGAFSYGVDDDTMYVERFEAFEDNSMALMISVLKLATELSCSRCIMTVAEKDVDGYENILEGIELDVSDGKGIMVHILTPEVQKYLDIMVNNTFIDEIV